MTHLVSNLSALPSPASPPPLLPHALPSLPSPSLSQSPSGTRRLSTRSRPISTSPRCRLSSPPISPSTSRPALLRECSWRTWASRTSYGWSSAVSPARHRWKEKKKKVWRTAAAQKPSVPLWHFPSARCFFFFFPLKLPPPSRPHSRGDSSLRC